MDDILISIGKSTFANLMANLGASFIKNTASKMDLSISTFNNNFKDHIENTYIKCTKIKTILNDSPMDFLDLYVEQKFIMAGNEIDHFRLVEMIKDGESACILARGGEGKSMFMRYLWISFFIDSKGTIPFFLELRQLNSLTHKKIEDFAYHTVIRSGSRVSQKRFREAMKNGEFVFFLDGFDEINVSLREEFESQIIELKNDNPKLRIVVTSRDDDRFSGWHRFHTCRVLPMDKEQCISLVTKAQYPTDSKSLLLEKIGKGLFDTHKDFLSSPLLCYMMLVTISNNSDIPNRMFEFYEQAFEALYSRHDLTKSGFKRKFYCTLDKYEFIRLISYFSLITHYRSLLEFDGSQLVEAIDKAKFVESIEVDSDDFQQDLLESVCILKKEGNTFSFTHRSFQEYFSAYCISRVASKNVEKIFSSLARRYNDQVLGMVYDQDPYTFREKYVIPLYKKYQDFFDSPISESSIFQFFDACRGSFQIRLKSQLNEREIEYHGATKSRRNPRDRARITLKCEGDLWALYQNLRRLNADSIRELKKIANNNGPGKDDYEFADQLRNKFSSTEPTNVIFTVKNGKPVFMCGKKILNNIPMEEFRCTGMYRYIEKNTLITHTFVNSEKKQFDSVSDNLDDIFD